MTADLIARLKGECSGSRELDGLIHRLMFPDEMLMTDPGSVGPVKRIAVYQPVGSLPDLHGQVVAECLPGVARYTTSLDAAMALADRLLPDWFWQFDVEPGQSYAQGAPESWPEGLVASDRGGAYQMGATLPMAICQAVVQAVLRRD